MRVALAQIDPTVGDIDGNAAKIAEWIDRARAAGAELTIFPELCLPGYPAEDLYLKRHFIEANRRAVEELARGVERDRPSWSASPSRPPGAATPAAPTTRLAVLADGAVRGGLPQEPAAQLRRLRRAALLHPRRRAADDRRRRPAGRADDLRGRLGARAAGRDRGRAGGAADRQPLGLALPPRQGPRAGGDVRRALARLRRLLRLLQPGRRPGRAGLRRPEPGHRPRRRADRPRRPVRGGAAALRDPRGGARAASPSRSPTSTRSTGRWSWACATTSPRTASSHVGVALSGGIDSALVALLAADAVGPERLSCVVMPSPHSSPETQGDARTIAANLGCELIEIPIEPMMAGYERALAGHLNPGPTPDVGEELPPRDPRDPPSPTWRRRTSRRGSAAT